MRSLILSRCSSAKVVDIARQCGVSSVLMYRLLSDESSNRHMRIVLRVCSGLSRITGESSEDIFVEYILGDVCGCGVVGSFEDVRSWLDHYKGEYYYQDVCAVMGVDKQVVTNWTKRKNLPTDKFFRWLLSSLVSLTGGNEEEMCRSFFRTVMRLG